MCLLIEGRETMMEIGGGAWEGNNRNDELIGTKKKEKLTLMGEEPPWGRGQTPFWGALMAEERSLQEEKMTFFNH
jgi:hypothetical protein